MRTLTRKVKWAAIGVCSVAVASLVWPVVADVLTALTWLSWTVILGLLSRRVPTPAWVRASAHQAATTAAVTALSWVQLTSWPWVRSRPGVVSGPARRPGQAGAWSPARLGWRPEHAD